MKESQKVEIVIAVEKGNKAAQTLNKGEGTMHVHQKKKATGQLLAHGLKKKSRCVAAGLDNDQMTVKEGVAEKGRTRMIDERVKLNEKTLLTLESRIIVASSVGKGGLRRSLLHRTRVQSIS